MRPCETAPTNRWLKITNDPRYAMQQLKRSGAGPELQAAPQPAPAEVEPMFNPDTTAEAEAAPETATPMTEGDFPGGVLPRGLARALIPPRSRQSEFLSEFPEAAVSPNARKRMNRFRKDWSETEGNDGTTGLGNFPATFTSTSASCTADFAVYNTGLAGSSSQANIIAFNQLYTWLHSAALHLLGLRYRRNRGNVGRAFA